MSFHQHGGLLTRDKPWTFKEMTQTLSELQKDNFNLRLRIYYLEYEGGSRNCSSYAEEIHNTELSRCREELDNMEALFHQEKKLRLQLEKQLQAYRLQDPPSQDQSQSDSCPHGQKQELVFILEERDRHIKQLQVALKAQDSIIKQLKKSSTNQGSGDSAHTHPSSLITQREGDIRDLKDLLELKDFELAEIKISQETNMSDFLQALQDKEQQLQDLKDLLELKDFELAEIKINQETNMSDFLQALQDKEQQLQENVTELQSLNDLLCSHKDTMQELYHLLESHTQDLAEKDATLAESRSNLKNLQADMSKLTLLLEDREQQLQESVRERELLSTHLQESVKERELLSAHLQESVRNRELLSAQLQESVKERELLSAHLRDPEALSHAAHQSPALEQRFLEVLRLKQRLEESIRRNQDLFRLLQDTERASVKNHSESDSVCENIIRPVIRSSVLLSDSAQPQNSSSSSSSSGAHGPGLHILVPCEIYDALLEQMREGRSLISHVRNLLQQSLQVHDQHRTQTVDQNLFRGLLHITSAVHSTLDQASGLITSSEAFIESNSSRERPHFFFEENLKLKNELVEVKSELFQVKKEQTLNKKMLSEAVKRLQRVNSRKESLVLNLTEPHWS